MSRNPTLVQTNFSAGEVSDLVEARPDVGKRYNAVRTYENFWAYPEGGAYRRPGTKMICEVKDSSKLTFLIPFEFAYDDAFVIEVGEGYFRFIKNREQIGSGAGTVLEDTFDADIAAWTDASIGSGVIEWSAGSMKLDANGSSPTHVAAARKSITTVPATEYSLSFDIVTGTGATGNAVWVKVGTVADASNLASQTFSALGTHTFTFTAIGTTTYIQFQVSSPSTVPTKYIDNVLIVQNTYEVTGTPYTTADLRNIHFRQSADTMFLVDGAHEPQRLIRLTDDDWSRSNFNADPPPSFNADEDFNVIGALSANTGTVKFRVATDQFLAGDDDRLLVAGTGKGNITGVDSAKQLSVEITDDFSQDITGSAVPLTSVGTTVTSLGHGLSAGYGIILTSGAQAGEIRMIASITDGDTYEIDAAFSIDQASDVSYNWTPGFAAGAWFLRNAPSATCDVNKSKPIGARVTITFSVAAARSRYVGKFIKLLGGLIELTGYTNTTTMTGVIKALLIDSTTYNPAAVDIGAWRLHESSWSTARGWPRTLEFHQGRLVFAGTTTQPSTVWGCNLSDLNNFAVGALATDSYEFTVQSRNQDVIRAMISLGSLFIFTAKEEHVARGPGTDAPLGGDVTPMVKTIATVGSQRVQPVAVDNMVVTLQAFQSQIHTLGYSVSDSADADSWVATDLTVFARQIGEMMFSQHRPAYYQIPNTIVFFLLENGQIGALTFKPRQEVVAWARTKTAATLAGDGVIESIAIVPHESGQRMIVHAVVKRVIDGETKRFIEYFEDDDDNVSERGWGSLHTDCAVTGSLPAATSTIAVAHLEGETVDVIIGNTAIAQKVVTGGVVTLDEAEIPEADTVYEVGLHYDATLKTLRPSVPNEATDCLKRQWKSVFVRLRNTIGGKINGKPLKPQTGVGGARMFTGLAKMENLKTTDPYDGALTILQDQPYPMTVLNISGQVAFADEAT